MTTEVVLDDNREVIFSNATVTASGSVTVTSYGGKEVILVINVSGSVTGTSPQLQFTIQEVDPGDEATAIGVTVTGAVITATGVQIIAIPVSRSSFFKVSWTVTGAAATFNNVYATLVNKGAGASVLYDNLGNSVFGTAGTPGTAVLTVQGVPGGTASPVSGTVTSNQGTAAALSGAWPVEVTDGTNVLGTAAFPVRTDPTGTTTQPVSMPDVVASGTIIAVNGAVTTTSLDGVGSFTIQITGTWTGTIQFEASVDGTTYVNINARTTNSGTVGVSTTANGVFRAPRPGYQFFRCRASAWTSGTATVTIREASASAAAVLLAEALPTGANTIGAVTGSGNFNVVGPGAAGAAISGNPVRIGLSDGANTRNVLGDTSGRIIVVGAAASGAAVAGNPVLVAGSDGTNAQPIRVASDGTIRVDPTGTTTQPVSGTVAATQSTGSGAASTYWTVRLSDGASYYAAPTASQLPAALVGGRLDTNIGSWLGSTAPSVGQKTSANSIPTVIASDQSAIPITGSVTASNPSVGTNNAAIPGSSTQIGGSDGTNLQAARIFDVDSGAGTQYVLGVNLRKTASGGSVDFGTGTDPIRIDPTGTTTQPVSGTVTGNQGTPNTIANSWPVEVTDGTNVLGTAAHPIRTDPTGTTTQPVSGTVTAQQATAGNLNATVVQGAGSGTAGTYWYVRVTDGTNTLPTMDVAGRAGFQKITDGTNTASVTASSALKVDGSAVTQPVSGTVTSNQGTGTGAGAPWSIELSDGAAFYVAAKTGQFPSALVGGRLDTNVGSWLGSTAPTVGQKTSANSIPIVVASDQSAFPVSQSGTWTVQQGTPPWQVVGPGAAGAAVTGNPVIMGGSDGANARYVSVDSSGRQVMVGAAASGAAVAGNPVLIGGSDGANARSITVDTNGRIVAVSPTASNFNATVTQGPAAALSGYWPVRVTDGTNTFPTADVASRKAFFALTDGTNTTAVKAASTAAAAADPSAVVALSPNSPLPTGSNTIGSLTANQSVNVAQIAGSATATAATGVQKVGVVGNAGATTDATLAAGTAPTNGYGTLGQYNTSQPAPTNGQTLSLQTDQAGNLLRFPGVQTKTGAAWTSATALNTLQFPTGTATVGAPLGGLAVIVQLDQTTTLTAGAVTFEGTYDGINWVTIPTDQVVNPQTFVALTNPYTFVASTNQPFLIVLQGFQQIRARLSTVITGTGSVTPYWSVRSDVTTLSEGAAGSTVPAQTTQVGGSDGTNLRAILTDTSGRQVVVGAAASGVAVAGNPVRIAGSDGTNTRDVLTDTSGRVVTTPRSSTSSVTSVTASASNVTLLASNTSRAGATIENDYTSSGSLFLKLGTTASTTSYTVRIRPGAYYEVPFGYTGQIDGIWNSATSGAARITELT
jgi:hypothetical protein